MNVNLVLIFHRDRSIVLIYPNREKFIQIRLIIQFLWYQDSAYLKWTQVRSTDHDRVLTALHAFKRCTVYDIIIIGPSLPYTASLNADFRRAIKALPLRLHKALIIPNETTQHISNLTRSSHLQQLQKRLRNIHIRTTVSVPIFTSIIHAFICNKIDYCNSLLVGLLKIRISRFPPVL